MGIYRGPGGTGDAVNDASSEALITVQAKDAALAAQAAAEAARDAALLAETNAETAEANAELAEANAEAAEAGVAASAAAAAASASNAASSASAASTSASNASTSASNAASSASAASTSASNAASSASTATTQATNASNSASAAATSATNASNSASAAATSATNAANSATAAQTAQTAAELAETNAETAEANAELAETNAETAATNAAASESAAASSASNAASSASSASTSASNAATSATNAANSASAASTSATNAANSASAALTSENNAASSASAAATSASNAATSATSASNSASAAATSETNAANSASAAATSASNASTSASNAATSATNASNSASAAATSATNASNSASAAATSASNASTSESNAASSASAAAASYDSFDDRYLGAKSSAPTLDNDGNTLLVGALYFDTVSNFMKVWDGSSWLDAYASLSGALLAANNLSDLTNAATARDNLGVEIGVDVQAYDAQLADIAGLTPADNNFIVGNGTNFVTESGSTARTSLGLGSIATQDANNVAVTGGSINGTTVGASTPSTGSFTSLTDSGNLTFTGTGNRITGDMTNATLSNRVAFQTSTSNTTTILSVIPNGTGTSSAIQFYNNSSDLENASVADFRVVGTTDVRVTSTRNGTGTFLPLTMYTGGSERLRIDTSGNVGIGTSSPSTRLNVVGNDGVVARFKGSTGPNLKIESYSGNNEVISETGNLLTGAISGNYQIYTGTGTANLRMTVASDGNVGIGTSSPAVRLDVVGLSGGSTQLTVSDGANQGRIQLSKSGSFYGFAGGPDWGGVLFYSNNATERMRIDTSGNVGIGTSSPGTYNGLLNVKSSDRAAIGYFGGTTYAVRLGANSSVATVEAVDAATGVSSYQPLQMGGSLLKFDTAGTERVRIDSSGNVGIGTSSPSTKLHLFNSGSTDTRITIGNGTAAIQAGAESSGQCFFGTSQAQPIYLYTNGSERMRITSGGNVAIGNTAADKRLEVFENNASTTTTTGILVTNFNATSNSRAGIVFRNFDNYGSAIWSPRTGSTAGELVFGTKLETGNIGETDITERMRITRSGSVGIGTSSPTANLTVRDPNGSSSGNLSLAAVSGGGGASRIIMGNGDSGGTAGPSMIVAANREMYFGVGDSFTSATGGNFTSRMMITSGGSVGIGTTSPSTALHVNGTVTASSFIGSGVARAWVYFNGGSASIMGSYNVGSVTRNSGGQYTINFTSNLPNGNYAAAGMTYDNGNNGRCLAYDNTYRGNAVNGLGVTVVDFGYNRFDANRISVVVFG